MSRVSCFFLTQWSIPHLFNVQFSLTPAQFSIVDWKLYSSARPTVKPWSPVVLCQSSCLLCSQRRLRLSEISYTYHGIVRLSPLLLHALGTDSCILSATQMPPKPLSVDCWKYFCCALLAPRAHWWRWGSWMICCGSVICLVSQIKLANSLVNFGAHDNMLID